MSQAINEILLMSYWEQVKAEKELARYLPPTDKRRVRLNEAASEILSIMNSES